ncbi:MerR family transcriptional regulator [Bifidobacterium sp. ESL0784]|uniref:MerR family transcriptional regulator n=1 Tax=Bifidobacterium sp. ESL0784 TaxID=2983231 RepID=UPI0023F870A0|nr:MerR family transcriptional regulator [Bifidobacterium sp. ESL0784]MDF7641496.1 MerR family transcriptional regulator [Bifidobacterium sp. ESL0784]
MVQRKTTTHPEHETLEEESDSATLRISDVSRLTGLPVPTLRYYERRGILAPRRDPEGHRAYTRHDLEWIAFVQRLLGTGMPLRAIERYSRLRAQGDATIPERLAMLHHQDQLLAERIRQTQAQREFLAHKISTYNNKLKETKTENIADRAAANERTSQAAYIR